MNRSFVIAALSSAVMLTSLSVPAMGQGMSEYAGALGASSVTTGAAGRGAAGHRDAVNNLYGGASGMLNQVSGSGQSSSSTTNRTTSYATSPRGAKGKKTSKSIVGKTAASDEAALENLLKQRYDLSGNEIQVDPRTTVLTVGKMANQLFAEGQQAEKAGKLKEAETAYMRAVRLRNRFWGDNDPAVIRLYMLIGNLQMKQKRYDGAEPFFKRALQANLKKHGSGSYELVEYLDAMGNSYYGQQRYSDAANYFRQVKSLRERKLGPNDQLTLSSAIRLAKANAQRGDSSLLPASEQMLRSTVVTLESNPANSKAQLIAALEGLELVLRNENKASDADETLVRLNALRGGPPAPPTTSFESPTNVAPAEVKATDVEAKPAGNPTDLSDKPANTVPEAVPAVVPTADVHKATPDKQSAEASADKSDKKRKNK